MRLFPVVSVVVLLSSGRAYDDHDLRLAADLASRAGMALDNARIRLRAGSVVCFAKIAPGVCPVNGNCPVNNSNRITPTA